MTITGPATDGLRAPLLVPPNSEPLTGLAQKLSRASHEPLHDQISALLREQIISGRWRSHTRLPSEPELAQVFGVARGTVRRSIRTLLDEDLLVQHQGRGTFVNGATLEQSFAQEIISTSEALDRDGVNYRTQVVRRGVELASSDVRGRLALDEDASVVALRRVRSVEDTRVFLLDNYLPASRFPGLETRDLGSRRLFSVLESDFSTVIDAVHRTFEAMAASDEVARLLEVSPRSPVLFLQQTSYTAESVAIECSNVWIRGDRLRLSSWMRRPAAATD